MRRYLPLVGLHQTRTSRRPLAHHPEARQLPPAKALNPFEFGGFLREAFPEQRIALTYRTFVDHIFVLYTIMVHCINFVNRGDCRRCCDTRPGRKNGSAPEKKRARRNAERLKKKRSESASNGRDVNAVLIRHSSFCKTPHARPNRCFYLKNITN